MQRYNNNEKEIAEKQHNDAEMYRDENAKMKIISTAQDTQ